MLDQLVLQVKRLFSSKTNICKLVYKLTEKLHFHKKVLLAISIILLIGYSQFRSHFECQSHGNINKETMTNWCWNNGTTTVVLKNQAGDQMLNPVQQQQYIQKQITPHVGMGFKPAEDVEYELIKHDYMRNLWALLFLLVACSYVAQRRWSSIFQNEHKGKLQQSNMQPMPTPPKMPIIGHIHLLRDHQHNPWEGFEEIRKKFGHVVSLRMGIHPMVLVSSSEAMREILLKKCDIFSNRPNFQRHHIIFGGDKENSLALCNWSNTHRDRRKMCKRGIVPSRFSSRNQLLENIISKFVVNYVDNISKVTKENILYLTSDVFMDFLCSESHPHSDPTYREFVLGCDFVFWDINQSYLIDFLPFLTSLGLGFSYLRRLRRVTDFLRDYIDDKIFNPRLERISKLDKDLYGYEEGKEDYLDSIIIEHLARTTSMSEADYKVGFADLLAGHAAVANIIMRLLGHLALDRKIQNMICEEAEKADIYNLTVKPSLPVTEAAMQEALRIASSPIVPHVAREDTSIENYYVPKGTMVLFNNYHLNLSDGLWSNPREFDPMRFLKAVENEDGEKSYKLELPKYFMPFSVGLRQCLGYKMVETTSIVLVANLCRKFVFEASNEELVRRLLSPKGSVALDPDSECFELKLIPR